MNAKRRKQPSFYLPSPDEIAAATRSLRIERNNEAVPVGDYVTDASDRQEWKQEHERLNLLTAAERQAEEREYIDAGKTERLTRRANMLRDMAAGTPQRRGDANDGTERKIGKSQSHWKCWDVRFECRTRIAAGETVGNVMASFGIGEHERRVREFLELLRSEELIRATAMAKVVKMNGKTPWRVTDCKGVPLRMKDGKPLDRGGYATAMQAQQRADSINRSRSAEAKTPLTRRKKRAGRNAEIAKSRKERGGAVHRKRDVPRREQDENEK